MTAREAAETVAGGLVVFVGFVALLALIYMVTP